MLSLLLQDWTTLKGVTGASAVTLLQAQDGWLSLTGFRDVSLWLHVTEITGPPTLTVETLPSYDATLVKTLATTTSTGVNVTVARGDGSTTPLADLVRWSVTAPASTTWSITFRVFVCVSPIDRGFAVSRGDVRVTP